MNDTLKQIERCKEHLESVIDDPYQTGVLFSTVRSLENHINVLKEIVELLDDARRFNEITEAASNDSLASDGLEMIYFSMKDDDNG